MQSGRARLRPAHRYARPALGLYPVVRHRPASRYILGELAHLELRVAQLTRRRTSRLAYRAEAFVGGFGSDVNGATAIVRALAWPSA